MKRWITRVALCALGGAGMASSGIPIGEAQTPAAATQPAIVAAPSGDLVLDAGMHHLRSGAAREWSSFPAEAEGATLTLAFDARVNAHEHTLKLRHRDLKQSWRVLVNGTEIARLPPDGNDMITCWPVAPGLLRDGMNELRIAAPPGGASDDVMVGEITLLVRPKPAALAEGRLRVLVTDRDAGGPLPARITLTDERGVMMPMATGSAGPIAVRPGVVYTATGSAELELPAGQYLVHAGRGMEYSVATARVTVRAGTLAAETLAIERQVDTSGWAAMDTHIHTFTHSKHGDAAIEELMPAIAGEGVELPVSTEHNLRVDLDPAARTTGVRWAFTPLIGSEVTTGVGHFNVWPLAVEGPGIPPRPGDWAALGGSLARTAPGAIVILNHGRDLHGKFRPLDSGVHVGLTGERLDGQPFPANAMEVINSGAVRTNPLELVEDWMGLLNRGLLVTPIGASDSHDVARLFVGQARTYVRVADQEPDAIDLPAVAAAVRQGAVLVSYGLLAEARVGETGPGGLAVAQPGDLRVRVRVQGPSWAQAERVIFYVNGVARQTDEIANGDRGGTKWEGEMRVPRPAGDVVVVAVAVGPGIEAPFWPTARPYQPSSTEFAPYVLGVSGAVFVDVDGNGRFDSAFSQAERLVTNAPTLADLGRRLAGYDRAVAAQVGSLLRARDSAGWRAALATLATGLPPDVASGLRAYAAALTP